MPAPAEERIDYIDGLRAVAVLTVLVAHIALHRHMQGPLAHVLSEGAHGVDLFFVLSGFCLAYPTMKKWRSGAKVGFGLTDFAAKRIVRIVPPFYLASLVLIAAGVAVNLAGRSFVTELPAPMDMLKSFLFLDEHVHLINDSFWTLMVEFRWYFAFPLLLAVWLRSPRAFCAIGVASAVLYYFTRARGLDLGTLPGFMLGIVAADIHVGARLHAKAAMTIRRFAFPLAVVCALAGIAVESRALIPGFDGADVVWAFQPTIVGWQLAVFFFVVACGASSWLRAALAAPVLVATGVASYAIYLVHEPVVTLIVHKVNGPLAFAVAPVAALLAGFLFWRYAERPFTTGTLRRPLLDRVKPLVERAFVLMGVPAAIELDASRNRATSETEVIAAPPAGVLNVEHAVLGSP
jgi:peptidoglycan/LPS O-acetylase OafA/YrhL